jgi:hypothetical protein
LVGKTWFRFSQMKRDKRIRKRFILMFRSLIADLYRFDTSALSRSDRHVKTDIHRFVKTGTFTRLSWFWITITFCQDYGMIVEWTVNYRMYRLFICWSNAFEAE